jgi:drug/metabolite transporter (DMT)-like permease
MSDSSARVQGGQAPSTLRTAVRAVVAAAGAAVVVHGLFDLAGADFLVEPPGQAQTRVSATQAAFVAALAAAVGSALLALLARRSARPERLVLAIVAVGVLLLAVTPVVAAEQGLTVAALEVMHLAVAAAFLAVVLPAVSQRQPQR